MPIDGRDGAEDEVDERCDAFESAWLVGQRPRIVDFLESENREIRPQLFRELLLVELEYRRLRGESPTQRDYLHEFPEFASQIEAINLQYGDTAFVPPSACREESSTVDALRPGKQIAHFELIELLGSGAMGVAWKAWDSRLRRNVTLKFPRDRSMAENDLRRFLREGQSGAQLHHSQLASVHDMGRDGDIYYLVANYVEGENLRKFVLRQSLTFKTTALLCAEIAEALHHVHAKGIIHRDLKPANIIVDPTGSPHIIDFGLAKFLNDDCDLTVHGELVGTLAYMSPEQANGSAEQVSCKSDIYSLGIILFELLTGDCPFEGDRESVIRQILVRDPAPPRSIKRAIPRDLETICLKAIEKDPACRYSTSNDFAADLRSFADGKPIRARRANLLEQCGRLMRKRPTITAILTAAVTVLVGSGLLIASLRKQNRRLEGYRPVYVTSSPSGARIALVAIDPITNEPFNDAADIIRPTGRTPLTTEAKVGRYLVEAVLPNSNGPMFAEVIRGVGESSRPIESWANANIKAGLDPDTCHLSNIVLTSLADVSKQMVKITIDDQTRLMNPLLPKVLYVDADQTLPTDGDSPNSSVGKLLSTTSGGEPCITYEAAIEWAERNHKRIASAAEYDAIVKAIENGDGAQSVHDVFDDRPEYTTTTKADPTIGGNAVSNHLQDMHVLKGYGNPAALPEFLTWSDGSILAPHAYKSSRIAIRGVLSGTPRFLDSE